MYNCGQRLTEGSPEAERQRCRWLDDSEYIHYE